MPECPHEFSDPAFCADCTPREKPAPPPADPDAIPAIYRGRCMGDCGDPIEPGDQIVSAPGASGWMHQECR